MHARVRGTELYFDIDGMGLAPQGDRMVERPALFLLHGGPGGDHASLKTQMAELSEAAQLVYVDHRGSGRSRPADPATYTLDQNIDDLDALRDYLGLERIVLLGISYGGMVAQGYAIKYPMRLRGLVLVATSPSHRFMDDARAILAERGTPEQNRVCQRLWDASFESLDQLHEYYRVMGPLYSTTFRKDQFEDGWRRGKRNFEQLNLGFGGFLRTFDYTDRLHEIACPTLVIGGAHDWICPPEHSRLIASRIPGAQLRIFANSAHLIPADEHEVFIAAVTEFLSHV